MIITQRFLRELRKDTSMNYTENENTQFTPNACGETRVVGEKITRNKTTREAKIGTGDGLF
jgi:hypothetical protein